MDKELPKRKPTRLKNFDYSSAGAYFVTICTRDRKHILSEIVKTDFTATNKTINSAVGTQDRVAPDLPSGHTAVSHLVLSLVAIASNFLSL